MTICSLCLPALAIPSQLPTLPESFQESIGILETNSTPYLYSTKHPTSPSEFGLPHHSDLDSLSVSAKDCPICMLILKKVQHFVKDFEEMKNDTHSRYFVIKRQGHGVPDRWTFRLVQRLDGADGFSFLANSKNRNFLYLMDVIGFCVEPEESRYSVSSHDGESSRLVSSGHVRGAKVGPEAGSKATLSVVSGWIKDCVQKHERCRPPATPLPSRILDLEALDDPERIRLWETHGVKNYESYVTLSYCWGSDPSCHVRTTHSTLSDHLESISVQDLPQTYQDAIKVTRHLGIRYLWIDSLCICQDDLDDWARESAAMQQVYAGAYLSIAADNAAGSAQGFLKRPDRTHLPVTLKVNNGDSSSIGESGEEVIDISGYAFEVPPSKTISRRSWLELRQEPLTSRAWSTQERLLPQRVLHFASDQLFFECNHHFLSEDGVEVLGRWHSLYPSGEKTFTNIARKSRATATHQLWYLILEDYTNRQLTVKADRLPAISGLAAVIKSKLNSTADSATASNSAKEIEYVAGLWSDNLIEGLEWSALRSRSKDMILPDRLPLPGETGYLAPTWSPASYNGMSAHGMAMDGWVDIVIPTGFSVTLKNPQNPFGEVVDGWISLRGPMIRMQLSDLPDEDEAELPENFRRNMRLCTPRGDRYGLFSSFDGVRGQTDETRSWINNNKVYALIMSEGKGLEYTTETNMSYHALLVTAIPEDKRVIAGRREYRRVGTIHLNSECLGDDEQVIRDAGSFKEIVLV
ncbi:heterokaryon incompatibility protein-domain-containing protein [Fusarium oxysporum f. sp. albedinis]|nr:heterokaryon incompatibility protein-domain-containing protein [Fusarium oxysporum f. sp. albedinis]KAK2468718.1 hypothetical protein H9L39_19645 [Fusarium oxysporum f. sp. albedinis]